MANEKKCDFCIDNSGFYRIFENVKLPVYHNFCIDFISVDLCALCYADIFNKKHLQKKIKRFKDKK